MLKSCKALSVLLAVVLVLGSFAAIAEEAPGKTIGIAIYSMAADSCVSLVEDARAVADELGWEIVLLDANGDPATQADQIATLVSMNVDAIILNPTDTTSLIPSVQDAVNAGIPVAGVGMEMDQAGMDLLLFFAGMDDYNVAFTGCEWIVEQHAGQGAEVALITGAAGTDASNKTVAAYEDCLAESDLVSVGVYDGMFDTAESMAITEDLLVQYPDIKAIYCADHVMAAGAAEAIVDAGLEGTIDVVAAVGVTDYLSYVEEGLITCAAYVLIYKAGSFAVQTLADYFDGETELASKYYVAPVIVTTENVADAANIEFVFDPVQ